MGARELCMPSARHPPIRCSSRPLPWLPVSASPITEAQASQVIPPPRGSFPTSWPTPLNSRSPAPTPHKPALQPSQNDGCFFCTCLEPLAGGGIGVCSVPHCYFQILLLPSPGTFPSSGFHGLSPGHDSRLHLRAPGHHLALHSWSSQSTTALF